MNKSDDDLSIPAVEDLIARLDHRLHEQAPEVNETFWELRGSASPGSLRSPSRAETPSTADRPRR